MIAKMFVPFWGPVEDLMSDDKNHITLGIVGLFFDVISFVIPIGKFATGSIRLISNAGQLATQSNASFIHHADKNAVGIDATSVEPA